MHLRAPLTRRIGRVSCCYCNQSPNRSTLEVDAPAMQSHPHRRRAKACRLLLAAALSLVFFSSTPADLISKPACALLVPPRRLALTLRAVRDTTATPTPAGRGHESDAVLLADWEVMVLLHPDATLPDDGNNATCAFPGGASSPARALGRLPSSGRHAYTCAMPRPARRHKPFRAPRLITTTSSSADTAEEDPARSPEMLRWSGRLVYDSVALHGGDVLVFAKGVNPRQGVNRAASGVRCVYYLRSAVADAIVASFPAATSAQEVFRCPPPPTPATELRVTLAVEGEELIPSLAIYSPPRGGSTPPEKKKLVCACTMVRDVAKFLREWAVYHAAVGVDRFFIYDNGSEDDLAGQVRHLSSAGLDISTHAWPWPKTQEAGFSHAAAVHQDSCQWMAFVDVDEFIFSPGWTKSRKPSKSMLRSIVDVDPNVGQVTLGCADFGPSGQTTDPKEGVTQGYTCRRRDEERHKSLVRLDSVDPSLVNSIHHFWLRPEFRWERSRRARVNHYKYQAWDEFKVKFCRRVSTYVADWTDPVNPASRDRTPGLGLKAVQPAGWAHKFCEVEDTLLRDMTWRWFGVGFRKKPAAGDLDPRF
ncbi:glycosyltransferase family 92 protein Os08g0121900 [Phragmites australis]|uniref:glycosyltransferase family 92 protein Os08g0121900 n=1 Tax=Phragmites australis TaxID=29695 RepID=UPI002D76BE42|nr:glycosyltransferase family 92 protein Os08g0121900 [Phragmites australis]